jgi:hypothetical protein
MIEIEITSRAPLTIESLSPGPPLMTEMSITPGLPTAIEIGITALAPVRR